MNLNSRLARLQIWTPGMAYTLDGMKSRLIGDPSGNLLSFGIPDLTDRNTVALLVGIYQERRPSFICPDPVLTSVAVRGLLHPSTLEILVCELDALVAAHFHEVTH